MILDIVRQGLCTQCGFCAALCPTGAITMQPDPWSNRFPSLSEKDCSLCRLCLDICSGRHFPFGGPQNPAGFGEDALPLGPHRLLGSGHATDEALRRRASSGGVATLLLAGAIERGLVKRALVVAGSAGSPWTAEARFATTAEEVRQASGSWYLPVSMEGAVREAFRADGPCAVVGLPCHIQAWRKASARLPVLGEKVNLAVGLFCDHLVDSRFWRLLFRKCGLDPARLRAIRFRGEGWPGSIRLLLDSGEEKVIAYGHPLRKLLWKSYCFTPRRCLYCHDALAEFADVSVGDAWLPEFADDNLGRNAVIVRTPGGESLCRELAAEGTLALEPLAADRLARSQRLQLVMKKRQLGARFSLAKLFGRQTPDYETPLPAAGEMGYLIGGAALAAGAVSRARWFWPLAPFLPWRTAAALYRLTAGGPRG